MSSPSRSVKKPVILLAIAGLIVFAFLLVQPLPKATKENCTAHEGAVASVSNGSSGDIVIRLKDDKHFYYINRGVESGLTVSDLHNRLLNKPVQLLTIRSSNPLDIAPISRHIARLKSDDIVIYSEL